MYKLQRARDLFFDIEAHLMADYGWTERDGNKLYLELGL